MLTSICTRLLLTPTACPLGDVVNVISRVTFLDENSLVTICNRNRTSRLQSYVIAAIRVIISPVCNSGRGASTGIGIGIIGFIDNSGCVYFDNLPIITDNAIITSNRRGTGIDSIGVRNYGFIIRLN